MLSWARGLLARYRLRSSVAVWYHPGYAPASLSRQSRVPNLELERAELVIEQLARERVLPAGQVRSAPPIPTRDLLRVHSPAYLESVATPEVLGRIFGLKPDEVEVDALLLAQRLMVGGTVAATEAVMVGEEPLRCAVNLGGGMHHAQPERGSGFCVLNDVAVAIARARSAGTATRVAIVDLDFHQGDGNIVAFAADESVLTYSIHGSTWTHVEAVANQGIWLPSGSADRLYLKTLRRTLGPALESHRPDLIYFLAGNDVLAQDRLGDFLLTPAGVLERDRHVIDTARDLDIPLVITLAGGYSDVAWQCSANMMRYVLSGRARARVVSPPDVGAHFRKVFEELDEAELQRESGEFSFTESDLYADLGPQRQRRLVLDFYTTHGVEYALERYGMLDQIRARGYAGLDVEVDPKDPAHQVLRIKGHTAEEPGVWHVLVELVARRQWIETPEKVAEAGRVEVLGVEWLLLQNPIASFTLAKPRLPGQRFPGLGLAREITEMLLRICDRLGLEGVLNRPAHFHTAGRVSPGFHFIDPEIEGRVMAFRSAVRGLAIADASNLIEDGHATLADGTPVPWQPADHVRPVRDRLVAYFESTEYREAAQAEAERLMRAGLTCAPR